MPRFCLVLILLCVGATARGAESQGFEFFEKEIRPLLAEHCYKCHSSQSEKLKGGLMLDSAEALARGGENGPVIVPGNPDKSRLIMAVRYSNEDLQMPPKKRLNPDQVAALEKWVREGAPFPASRAASPNSAADAPHWAFQPVRAAALPKVQNRRWPEQSIDYFILANLEKQNVAPSLPADRRTLIRRATYALHGLPPTAAETEAFAADRSPQAYANLVDKLLASPRYGEHWGRIWMDVARYADTKGYVYSDREEGRFVHSAVYRDWLIKALNDDMPYDRFLKLQIAADQLVPEGDPDQAAMGFLTLGRRFLGVIHDIIDDRLDVVMRGTQALTIGCARCHDHKFDPIPTKDYYSLYGIFAGSSEKLVRLDSRKPSDEFEKGMRERQEKLVQTYQKKREALTAQLRAHATPYLKAALHADKLPTEEFYEIRGLDDINPVVARQWQGYIQRSKSPVFAIWHALASLEADRFAGAAPSLLHQLRDSNPVIAKALAGMSLTGMTQVAEIYGNVFQKVNSDWLAMKEKAEALADPAEEQIRGVLYGPDSPANIPQGPIVDIEWFFDEPSRVELSKLQVEIDRYILKAANAPDYSVILCDKAEQRLPRVFKRGNPANKGEEIPRQFLQALAGSNRQPFKNGSGRLELAQGIADPRNPLTARVIVNRVWKEHFGAGLVRTPSDFGKRSESPSHPELLDWLAADFMANGWSLKRLHRELLLSATFQERSEASSELLLRDPENRWLARMNRRRLDYEELHDALLSVTGELDAEFGGRAVPYSAANRRRAVYGYIDRQFLPGVLRIFDFANPDMHSPQRAETTVPQQALFLLNNSFTTERARALAKALEANGPSDEMKIELLYANVYQRHPTHAQLRRGLDYLKSAAALPSFEHPAPPKSPWQYGYGSFDTNSQRVTTFEALPYFGGGAWQGGSAWPDKKLGWVRLTAQGGHVGNDLQHAAIRRWTAPEDCTLRVTGTIQHEHKEGDGIRARIVSSAKGELGQWKIYNGKVEANIESVELKAGQTLDFVADLGDNLNNDDFKWAPLLSALTGAKKQWNAEADFRGPPEEWPAPLSPLAQYAQALLLSNEFAFID